MNGTTSVTIEVQFEHHRTVDPREELFLLREALEQMEAPIGVSSVRVRDDDYDIAAVVEQDDGTHIIQLMNRRDPEDDPHGDGAMLARELTADDVMVDD